MTATDVVVVGGGISGVACARVLADSGLPVRVLERGHVAGGRMATKRFDGRPADIGAGYFTARNPEFGGVAQRWRAAGLAREWTDTMRVWSPDVHGLTTGPVRWAAPGGLRSLVADLTTGLDLRVAHEVHEIAPGPMVDGEPVAAVVLAMPGPQALRLLDPQLTTTRTALEWQRWLPALVATLRYPGRTWKDFDGAFVNGDPVLSAVFDDGSRRGDGAPVLVAHSTAEFAGCHLADPAAAAKEMAAAVARVVAVGQPAVHVHRWTFARPERDGATPFHLDEDGIGVCGDAWGSSKVETAWLSGTLLGRALRDRLG
jgi:renalase